MADVYTNTLQFPAPLGKLAPGADFAAKSVPLTTNKRPVFKDRDGVDQPDTRFNAIWVQAHPDNTGYIYVCSTADAPDTTDYANVLGVLSAGEWWPRTKEWANNRDLTALYIGASDEASFAIAIIDQF